MSTDGPIHHKYDVRRTDRAEEDPTSKHYGGCRAFVLDIDHDPYGRVAARAYADACEATHPQLATALRDMAFAADEPKPSTPWHPVTGPHPPEDPDYPGYSVDVWVTDGHSIRLGYRTYLGNYRAAEDDDPVTHWAPLNRPALPEVHA